MLRKTIAVAMIVKNEEELLSRCLETVKGADAIYILDTGSRDRTIEIARRYTDKVFLDFIWTDDFSQAQNFIKSKVKEDWILSIDADEQLLCPWSDVQAAVDEAENVVRVKMVAEGDFAETNFHFGRLFRNTPDIFWCQSIHKHLNVPGEGEEVGNVSIMYGYSPAHELDIDRSLRMLERAVATEDNPIRNLYYLGREYWYKGRYQDSIDTFQRYIKVSNWPAEKAEAYMNMGQCYMALGQYQEGSDCLLQAIKINTNFKEAIDVLASISTHENAIQWRRLSKTANNRDVLWNRVPAEPAPDVIFLAPHNDDESLFGAFTLIRVKPLVIVCTDSYIQYMRGDVGCEAAIRREETIKAMAIAECPVAFLGIPDTGLTEEILRDRLKHFKPEQIYVPAIQGGNAQHDLVGKVAMELFGDKCERYTTYTKTELYTTGNYEIKPKHDEMDKKLRMLNCYESQLNLKSTLPHFMAVKGKSEWLL